MSNDKLVFYNVWVQKPEGEGDFEHVAKTTNNNFCDLVAAVLMLHPEMVGIEISVAEDVDG